MTQSKYLGLCLLGECIIRLIDSGKKENVEAIQKKALDKELVSYLTKKYKFDFPSESYDIGFFEDFFFENLLESSKSGVFNNGLLTIICTILDKAESTTPA